VAVAAADEGVGQLRHALTGLARRSAASAWPRHRSGPIRASKAEKPQLFHAKRPFKRSKMCSLSTPPARWVQGESWVAGAPGAVLSSASLWSGWGAAVVQGWLSVGACQRWRGWRRADRLGLSRWVGQGF
jgi:hypothetical protein